MQQNGRHSGHVFILAHRKIIIEEAKTPPMTLVNELSTSAVANDQQSMHKMPPTINDVGSSLLTAPAEE